MTSRREGRLVEGGAEDDVLRGGRRNDTINGNGGDDVIIGRRGRDVMYGGEGSDTFAFDDLDTGDVSWGLADAIGDFGIDDLIDLRQTEVFRFDGFDVIDPARGAYSIWRGGDNVYVTWNTHGRLQDIELTGFTGDHYALGNHVLWYEDDYAGTVATEGVLVAGEAVQGRIETTGDEDWFRIEVEAGQLYTFDIQGAVDGGGTLVDPYLVLRDENGNYVSEGYEVLYHEATTAGAFFVSAQSWSVGTYTLVTTAEPYVDDFGEGVDTEGRIAAGETVEGRIGTSSDRDWLQIELEAGQLYTVSLRGEAEGGGTLVDPGPELYDEFGSLLNSGFGELVSSVGEDGTYFIAATSLSGAIGTYTLEVAAEPYADDFGANGATAGAIQPGEILTGVVEVPLDQDWFAIELEADSSYTIDLRGQSSASGSLPDPFLRLLDSGGVEVAANDDTNGFDSQIVYTAETAGTFFIVARELGSQTGDYQLSVSDPAASRTEEDLLVA